MWAIEKSGWDKPSRELSQKLSERGEDISDVDQEVYKVNIEVKMRRNYVHGLIICGQFAVQLRLAGRCAEASR